uniref:Uncharacterized protein n=1 Tax=Pararge aegeria TaxID=116150 RepID=S4PQL8_9NEOP
MIWYHISGTGVLLTKELIHIANQTMLSVVPLTNGSPARRYAEERAIATTNYGCPIVVLGLNKLPSQGAKSGGALNG